MLKVLHLVLEEHDKHHWVQVVSPKTDDGQSKTIPELILQNG